MLKQTKLFNKNSFAWPGGRNPGFDQSHIASYKTRFSAIASGANFLNILKAQKGTLTATAPTAAIDGVIGPVGVFVNTDSANACNFTGQFAGTDSSITLAGIFVITSTANDSVVVSNSTGTTSVQLAAFGGGSPSMAGFLPAGGSTNFTNCIPAVNTPYFCIMSLSTGNNNCLLLNLKTGKIITQNTATAFTAGAASGTAQVGCWSNGVIMNGNIAAVMFSGNFLSLAQMQMWAADPWSFWYPNNDLLFRQLTAPSGAAPPGKQIYDRQPDPQDPFAQWRTWTQTRNPNLVLKDVFPPGKQAYDRQPDPQDAFSQWRTWTQTRNPNLVGLDVFPPGKQFYDRPLDPQDSFAQWRTWTWQYRPLLFRQDAFPPGRQFFDRQPDPQDSFAQWRTWTWQYRPILLGQDAFPSGKQLFDRSLDPQDGFTQWRAWAWQYRPLLAGQDVFPAGRQINYLPFGITWQPESPPQNLINTLLTTPPATIPPGQQLYARPNDLQDAFAQWRTWTQTANPNLAGQDAFPPGKREYQRPFDPQDAFAQWRTWTQTRNPNLAGQDVFPPGRNFYDLPPAGPQPLTPAFAGFNINLFPPVTPPASQAVYATYFLGEGMGGMMTNPGEKPS